MKTLKKAFISCVVVFATLLCGCGSPLDTQNHKKPEESFEVVADISYNDLDAVVNIKRLQMGSYELDVVEPKNLSGLKASVHEGVVKLTYLGLSLPIEENKLLPSSTIKLLVGAIDEIFNPETQAKFKDGEGTISSTFDHYKFDVAFNSKTGQLLSIDVPSLKFKLTVRQ